MPRRTAPFGSWESPIGVEDVVRAGWGFVGPVELAPEGVYWLEGRPDEDGRSALMLAPSSGADPVEVMPRAFNVRTRVHEYGGGAFWRHGTTIFCSSFDDGRLYRQDEPGGEPRVITPEPSAPNALRYADGHLTPDGRLLLCVRESHADGTVRNDVVVLPADGSDVPRTVLSGNDFYSAPRPSPDGTRLAWLTWNDPFMPFEGTELWVGDLAADGRVSGPRRVAGSVRESVLQPEWRDDGVLHFVSDPTGWWNLYREEHEGVRNLCPLEAEFGFPPWAFGMSRYAFLPDGRIACIVGQDGIDSLELLDPETGLLRPVGLPFTTYVTPSLRALGSTLAFVAASPSESDAIATYDVASGELTIVRRPGEVQIEPEWISVPEPIVFPGTDDETTHAFFYPPRNPEFEAPEGELPPLRLIVHGGPTAQSFASLELPVQFWTSRGIAVVDVNYGGSTGYGRAYRDRLRGRWGIVDVEDCIAAARHLAATGRADPDRLCISGGSAGGYTTLLALARSEVFAAGVSAYGVADLISFHGETHKFEAHYDDYLVGPFDVNEELYRDRSPLTHADSITRPLLLLQGLEDKVVPPSQSEVMIEALERNGVPYAYLAFEGEGHGFRRAENIRRAVEAMLFFLSRIFDFEPADPVEPLEIKNLALTRP